MAFTNRFFYRVQEWIFNGGSVPSNFYLAFVTDATPPTSDTDTLSQLTEISAGGGYSAGGIQLSPNATDFPGLTEDDVNNDSEISMRNITVVASGGSIGPFRYAVLTDDNVTLGDREVFAFWDLGSDITVTDGQSFTLQDGLFRFRQP